MNVDHRSKITLMPKGALMRDHFFYKTSHHRQKHHRRKDVPGSLYREKDAKAQLARRQGPTGKQLRLFYLCSLLCLQSHLLHGVHVGGLRAAGLISVLFCSCSTPRKFQANPCPAQCCSLCPLISSLAVVWELNWRSGLPL